MRFESNRCKNAFNNFFRFISLLIGNFVFIFKNTKKDFERLPRHVVPSAYDLKLAVSFETFTFTGVVDISIDAKEPTNQIKLNSHQLDIFSAVIGDAKASISFDNDNQLLILDFADQIPQGTHSLVINYKGSG